MLLWGGQTVSEVGTQISVLVLPLLAVGVVNASTFQVTLLMAIETLPILLFALPAGVVADRVRRRMLMIWCNAGRLLLFASIPLAALVAEVTMAHLYVVAAGVGVLTIFFDVAYQSYLPSLVRTDQLMDGNGKLGTTQSLARFVGPSAGGGLVGLVGAAWAVAADALSYVVSSVTLLLIRTPEPVPVKSRTPRFRAELAEGLSFAWHHPVLRKVIACSATASLFAGSLEALLVLYLVRVLAAPPTVIGLVFSFAAVGGLAGGISAKWIARRIGTARTLWVPLVTCSPGYLLIPLAQPGLGVFLCSLGWGFFGYASVVYNTAQVSYRQSICPPELIGRLTASIRCVVWGALPLGALLGGQLATWFGIRATLWLTVVGIASSALWIIASPLRGCRDFPTTVAEPPGSPSRTADTNH
jgi:MFS family permease